MTSVPILATLGALVLAVTLGVAGIAKLRDRTGAIAAAHAFGVPGRLGWVVGTVLPVVELAIAVLLLPVATRWWAAVGALALLFAFCAAIGVALARGRTPACRCFGQLHATPIGWRTLLRNGVLVAAALVVVGAGSDRTGPGLLAWGTRLKGLEWLAVGLGAAVVGLVAVGGYALAHVLRSYGRVLVRLETVERRLREAGFELDDATPERGLPPGSVAPAFWLPSTDGRRVALDDLIDPGRALLLVFTSPTCDACRKLLPEIARWQRDHGDALTVVLVSDGDPARVAEDAAAHGIVDALLDERLVVTEAFGALGTPSAVLVDGHGRVASWLAAGGDWIGQLVEQALSGEGQAPGLPVGTEAPTACVAVLDGGESTVAALVRRATVVLFWNPGCGFCRALHHEVRAWESDGPDGAPALLVVSAGEPDDVGAEGFEAPVLLDPGWELAGAFGADGTPMAVLLDADGHVASPLVAGGSAVLELLGAPILSTAD